jgi:GT2 family glycosyltransferase
LPSNARVTVAVPSLNQGPYLDAALRSIFEQEVPVEVYVADAGSTDGSVETIRRWSGSLLGWRSRPDRGQAAAVNEALQQGSAPYVAWLNSDDLLVPGALLALIDALEAAPSAAMAYGRVWNHWERSGKRRPVFVRRFDPWLMAQLNIVSQPGTLIRRTAWEAVGGLDESLCMAMDYDLWWRLYRRFGDPVFVDAFVAINREHGATKTNTQRRLHYREAMAVVRKHYGRVPLKWWLAQPYAVWYRALFPGR